MKITDLLTQLLAQGIRGNQSQLVQVLADRGITTTQSTVSRALKKINAVKSSDTRGNVIYVLPSTQKKSGAAAQDFFESLVHGIAHNHHLVVIQTKPGTAMTVAKFIDDKHFDRVLGTVAGDDTIMIIPKDVSQTHRVADEVKVYLRSIGILD